MTTAFTGPHGAARTKPRHADITSGAVCASRSCRSSPVVLVGRSGRRVVAIEINQTFLDQGMARLRASLDKAVSRGKLTDTARDEILARIRPTDDIPAGVAGADLLIEAIPERMELKRTLFDQLDEACRADAILATNTSSLSITEIAGVTRYPPRVAGLHFFNPAPVMKLVEVISTVLTSPETAETLALLSRDLRKTPVQVSDRAGFIVNALLVPYLNHAVRLLETAQATREDIDKAANVGLGLPMGPRSRSSSAWTRSLPGTGRDSSPRHSPTRSSTTRSGCSRTVMPVQPTSTPR